MFMCAKSSSKEAITNNTNDEEQEEVMSDVHSPKIGTPAKTTPASSPARVDVKNGKQSHKTEVQNGQTSSMVKKPEGKVLLQTLDKMRS